MSNLPKIEEVYPQIYRVQIPLPESPLGNCNSYFILGKDKTTIVDVGMNHEECEKAIEAALEYLGRTWESVEIILTHSHPDHTGNLDRIWRRWIRIYAHMHSFVEVKNLQGLQSTVFNPLLVHLIDPSIRDNSVQERDADKYPISAELLPIKNQPDLFFLDDGDVYHNDNFHFSVIATPGHDDWHICLYEPKHKLFISGDHVLEHITPTIMSWMPSYNALQEFFNSLDKVRNLDVDIILPGHGDPFKDLAGRVDYLKEHHEQRLEELYFIVSDGHASIIDIARNAGWKHPNWDDWTLDQKFYSMGETYAHLIYLVNEGRLAMTTTQNKRRFYVVNDWELKPLEKRFKF